MSKRIRHGFVVALFLGITTTPLLAGPNPPPPQAVNPADGCGQTLPKATDNGTKEYVLTGDLACSGAVSGVIIAASDVVFHLAGHTISNTTCDLNVTFGGIFVQGGISGVQIDGGTVSGFNDGIILSSSNSRVRSMRVANACVFGMAVSGQNNRIETSVVTASGVDGIGLGQASGTVVTANDISGNARVGVDISNFSNANIVENNLINNNGTTEGYGVAIFNGTNNLIRGNAVNGNVNGIGIDSPGNLARDNTVSGSTNTGIAISTVGAPSTVRRNSVLGSGVTDMSDGSANCGTNIWRHNTFHTDLVVGVADGGPGAGCI